MEQDKSVSEYFDFNDAAFQFGSNFEEEIPSKHLKVDKKSKQSPFLNIGAEQSAQSPILNKGAEQSAQSPFFNIGAEQSAKRTGKQKNPTNPKTTSAALNPSMPAALQEFSNNNPDTDKPMDVNSLLQEMNRSWQETLSNFAPQLIARENYEEECLQYVKNLTQQSQLQLQKVTAQKEKICNKLDQITNALKRKS